MTSRRLRLPPFGSLATGAVALVAGLLFTTSASIFADGGGRDAVDLESLARTQADRLLELESENAALREQIRPYVELEAAPQPFAAEVAALGAGQEAVAGPGLRVQLWDAPVDPQNHELPADSYVVHQQDLEAVMNALWAGGAEAMSVQGHRVVSTTGVRCVGNVLHIQGRTYSPPYVVEAIGDTGGLQDALDASDGVRIYRQYVDAIGLGWSVDTADRLELPAYAGSLTLQHAEVIEEDV